MLLLSRSFMILSGIYKSRHNKQRNECKFLSFYYVLALIAFDSLITEAALRKRHQGRSVKTSRRMHFINIKASPVEAVWPFFGLSSIKKSLFYFRTRTTNTKTFFCNGQKNIFSRKLRKAENFNFSGLFFCDIPIRSSR